MSEKKQILNQDLAIFEKNGKTEFAQIIRNNRRKTTKALNFFLNGVKNEAIDTRETSIIIVKYLATQRISKEEEKHLKLQVQDLFKILGIGIPFMVIPGATLLIPFILKAAQKKGIDLIPSNFKSKDKI
jgi:hypothetical protein